MKFRSQASLRLAASLAALLVVSACSDNRLDQLSAVQTIDIPAADPGAQVNQNINMPTLEIPETYPVKDGDELTLVWWEEFDGAEIEARKWFFATGDGTEKGLPGGWGNNELQYYLPDNAMIVNGVLEITARRETVGDLNYTSARINTEDRFAFKYGRIEASIKMPSGQGLWPAFWMLSQSEDLSKNSDYTCGGEQRECIWAATGEIDIVEAVNLDGTGGNEIYGTLHYGGEAPANTFTGDTYTPSVDVTADFHTYALEWDENEIRWYFDGQLYAMQNSWFSTADNGGPGAPFNQPFHILLNLAVGGNFPGSPNGTTPFPATMEVDWVRVYSGEEPADHGGDGDGDGDGDGGTVLATFDEAEPPTPGVFGNAVASIEAGPAGGDGDALKITRSVTGFSGAFITIPAIPSDAGSQTVSAYVYSPTAGIRFAAKAEYASEQGTGNVDANEAVIVGWQTLTWTFTNLDAAQEYDVFVMLPNLDVVDTESYYVDNITLVGGDTGGAGDGTGDGGTVLTTFDEAEPPTPGVFGNAVASIEAGPAGGDGDALKITRSVTGFSGAFIIIPAIPSDAGSQTVSAYVYSPTADIRFAAKAEYASEQGTGNVDANEAVIVGWQTLTWTFTNLDAAQEYDVFVMLPNLDVVDTESYYVDNITLVGGDTGGAGDCVRGPGPELATNGDIEAGDLTCFDVFTDFGGVATADNTQNHTDGGTWSVHAVSNGNRASTVIKQSFLAAGTVMNGDTIDVSFWMKGTAADGGVINPKVIAEGAGDAAVGFELNPNIPAPGADWTQYSYSQQVNADVTRGVTFEIAVVCADIAECTADVFIDDVSVTIQ